MAVSDKTAVVGIVKRDVVVFDIFELKSDFIYRII